MVQIGTKPQYGAGLKSRNAHACVTILYSKQPTGHAYLKPAHGLHLPMEHLAGAA